MAKDKKLDIQTTGKDLATDALTGLAAQADAVGNALDITTQKIEVDTTNEFGLGCQANSVVRPIRFPEFLTKQQAFRFAAWLVFISEVLPDEPLDHTFLEIAEAIKNT